MIDRRLFVGGLAGAALVGTLSLGRPRAAGAKLRIASVKFGSLSWLLETIRAEGLDKKHGVAFDIIDVPSNQAGPVALLSDGADVIVSDWTWAMRQRAVGEKLKFYPYSSALGALVVAGGSGIKTVADLKGRTLGVAGSNIDKSWLLLRMYTKKVVGTDVADLAKTSFGAAPLLTEEIRNGRVDAVLNFWTFAARLTGAGFTSILTMDEVLKALDIDPVPSLVGFVWKERYAAEHAAELQALFKAASEANALLAASDAPWERLRPLMRAADDREFKALQAGYRAGIPSGWGEGEMRSAAKLMHLLIDAGDTELVGANAKFDAALFHNAAG